MKPIISVIGIGIGRYEKISIGNLSVSADKKIRFIGGYRYRPIWKKAYRSYTGLSVISQTHDIRLLAAIYEIKINLA